MVGTSADHRQQKEKLVGRYHSLAFLNLRLLVTTLTLLIAMAALAIIGLRRKPFIGYKTPAATGTPIILPIGGIKLIK